MEFASFAMLAIPGHRSGLVLTPPGYAKSPICTSARLKARNSSPGLIFKIFFCRHQAQDLRQIRAPTDLTS
jgi:hypothetical protein